VPVVESMILPVPGGHITQSDHDQHSIDVGAPLGSPILALAGGWVVAVRCEQGYGQTVRVESPEQRILYAHCAQALVEVGAAVRRGQIIARVGSTGDSTGPHVHVKRRLLPSGELVSPQPLFSYAEAP
jgi:murein DD-endopeptidase MepM/ murein hydrolase activator NlpD